MSLRCTRTKDLIRFLKAIVPDEAEGADSPCIFQILPSFSSLLSPRLDEAEDMSLGAGPAGHSGQTQELSTTNTDSGVHPSLSQSNSEKKAARNIYKYFVIRLEMLCPLII